MALDADTSGCRLAVNEDADFSVWSSNFKITRWCASVYVDMRTLSGDTDGANGGGTSFGFGTSVSF